MAIIGSSGDTDSIAINDIDSWHFDDDSFAWSADNIHPSGNRRDFHHNDASGGFDHHDCCADFYVGNHATVDDEAIDDETPRNWPHDNDASLLQDHQRDSLLRTKVDGAQTRPEEGPSEDQHHEAENEEVTQVMQARRAQVLEVTKGFMPIDEGNALLTAATSVSIEGPFLEVGAYCGKSSVYLGTAAENRGTVLFSLDHHRGSEENQAGWEHHDQAVVDPQTGRMDTLPFFRRTIEAAELEDAVVALVGKSAPVAKAWATPLAFLFIDGGHGVEPARQDYLLWTPKVAPGGLLAIHDVFPDPTDGGRPPYEEIYLPTLRSGLFEELPDLNCGSLKILRRL